MDKPNGRLVLVSYTHYCASTSSLSTRWSFWALQGDYIDNSSHFVALYICKELFDLDMIIFMFCNCRHRYLLQ